MREDIIEVLKNSEIPLTEIQIQEKLENVSLDKLCEEIY